METEKITSVLHSVFGGADKRDWEQVEKAFAPQVIYDYTSMAGGQPLVLQPQEIIRMWKQLLPGFDKTAHHIADFDITIQGDTATARFTGHASHLIADAEWIVEGNYEVALEKNAAIWQITAFKFNLQNQGGDLQLPQKAMARVAG
ncbi:nuclear transport factor 2 family protein [Chitinophaga sp. HK235]|uniref:nuclear transport factor 2 family protein n=1 Tax=Chitinophaga sp. HK235 TaxID=2952571 RepID=UPI001BA883E9|nr:nuclear transport factor 2 family protein [Chitinophaga sp. HK235]